MTVRLMGPYKRAAGIDDDVSLSPQEPNLGGVLTAIASRFPEAGRKLQPAPGKIEAAVRVVVNDVVQQGATPALLLKDGDRVAFVPIVGGGTTSARWFVNPTPGVLTTFLFPSRRLVGQRPPGAQP